MLENIETLFQESTIESIEIAETVLDEEMQVRVSVTDGTGTVTILADPYNTIQLGEALAEYSQEYDDVVSQLDQILADYYGMLELDLTAAPAEDPKYGDFEVMATDSFSV
jgi:hypothetical protein